LYLRRSHLDTGLMRLVNQSCTCLPILWRCSGNGRAGQPAQRRQPGLPLRSRAQPQLSATRRPLPGRDRSGATVQTQGQGQGRSGCADRGALDTGPPTASHVLHVGRGQPMHPRIADRVEHTSIPAIARQPEAGFEALEERALRPLPQWPYTYVDIRRCKVNIDYHVAYDTHHYSVPHQYVGEQVEVHASDRLVQVYFRQRRIACHRRAFRPGTTTQSGHMPERHSKHQKWTPGRLRNWAKDIGPDTLIWVTGRLNARDHPEQAYRVCLGLLSLSREY